ncbi:MAG: helix-turn-helix transcriptional regulator [Oscillatoriales cyanobacterium C42_A2020_001]|nr:helix-turn-helix transcriptional regulator [Leptolyngbyaceae cyanobacterium C42_A2020_001]
MTLILPQSDYWNLIEQAEPVHQDGSDRLDISQAYPALVGEGNYRQIQLRDGLHLEINDCKLHRSVVIESPDRDHPLEFEFFIQVDRDQPNIAVKAEEFGFHGSGMASAGISNWETSEPSRVVSVHMQPEVFRSFATAESGELPGELRHLIHRRDHPNYQRFGTPTPVMQIAVQQILQCPYQGLTKRMYLESKVLELMALLVAQEVEVNQGNFEHSLLRRSEIDRIYSAKEILLRRLDHPPSLTKLARLVGLNDRKLKQGFQQVFGTTVFGCLHHYRMELARKLLLGGNMTVMEVAASVGYASPTSFSTAFRKKFGTSPKSYRR